MRCFMEKINIALLCTLLTLFGYSSSAFALFDGSDSSNVGADWTNTNKNLHTTGSGTFDNDLAVGDDTTLTGDLTVSGAVTLNTTKFNSKVIRSDYDYASLAVAISSIGATPTRLFICQDNIVTDGTTITQPSTLTFDFTCGGSIDGVAGGGTETYISNGPVIKGIEDIIGSNITAVFNTPFTSIGSPDYNLSVEDFGAKGDDIVDDTAAFVLAAQYSNSVGGITITLNQGNYLIDSVTTTINGKPCGVPVYANTTFYGKASATVTIGANFPLDGIGFMNASGIQALDIYTDANIRYEGITFTDDRSYPAWNTDTPATYGPSALTASDLTGSIIRCFSCDRPIITNCTFKDTEVLNVAIGGCNYPEITYNNFIDTGYIYRGTYALWVSAEATNNTYTKNPKIIGNTWRNVDNAALLCGAGVNNAMVNDNQAFNVKEAAFHFVDQCDGLICTGNYIDGVYLGDISANGIEVENLNHALFAGNTIKACDRRAFAAIGIENSSIVGNTMLDNGAATNYPTGISSLSLGINGDPIADESRCGLLLAHGAVANVVDNVFVFGNQIHDSVGNQKYAISLGAAGTYRDYDKVTVTGNDLTDGYAISSIYWSTAALAGLPNNVKVYGNIAGDIIGPTSNSLLSSAYSARQQGAEAFERMLGVSCTPTLDLRAYDSKGNVNGIPTGFTFTRATNSTYFDYAGARQTAGAGILRHGYNKTTGEYLGWLLEPARTNSLLNSTSPATQTVSLAAGTYVLWIEGTGSCALSGGPTGTATEGVPVTFTLGGVTNVTFTVDGSVTAFQCELGTTPSSLITTAGAAVTRNADVLNIATSGFNFNAAEGTLLVEWMLPDVGGTSAGIIVALDDGTANELIYVQVSDNIASDPVRTQILDGGVSQFLSDMSLSNTTDVFHWTAFAYKANAASVTTDGRNPAVDTAVTLPTVTTLQIGGRAGGALPLNGYIRRVVYFPRALHTLNATSFRDMTRK